MSQDSAPSPLKLQRTDSVASQATSSNFNKQVWSLADEEVTRFVYEFMQSHKIPDSYQGPIMIEDEIFIIEQID